VRATIDLKLGAGVPATVRLAPPRAWQPAQARSVISCPRASEAGIWQPAAEAGKESPAAKGNRQSTLRAVTGHLSLSPTAEHRRLDAPGVPIKR